MKKAVVIILCFLSHILTAQTVADSLTVTEKYNLLVAYRNSCFGQLMLVDSCSKAGDSVAAGAHLMRVNPYYMLLEVPAPGVLDSFLQHHYLTTSAIRRKYLDTFTKVYNTPKSKAYLALEKMVEEDQLLRKLMEAATDDSTADSISDRILLSDSLHFAYLLKYVHRYKWPSIANGSIFASVIALHDHRHHSLYLPMLKEAVL
ncbi:MAG: hypothetical protein H7257_02830, partial [Taibaiella sp.]|nr:hypothetical protein [Taibaiella sp.]